MAETLQEVIDQTAALAKRALEQNSADACEMLDAQVRQVDALVREAMQARFRATYEAIAGRLERGETLSPAEEQALDLLLVGTGEAYLRAENNVEDWKAEIRRLVDEMRSTASGEADMPSVQKLRALCHDAMAVVPDLARYLREAERIRNYREAARSGDPERARVVAGVVRGMLGSTSY